jgi:glycerophosphoryl diester phosphodiesterase
MLRRLQSLAALPAAWLFLATASAAADGRVAVIAHRGWHRAPGVVGAENSIAALRAAQEARFWGSEFDVHMTLDERLVVRHDDKIGGTNIWQQPYAAIADFVLPNGERLPTLDEYLAQGSRSKSTMLVLEVKKEGGDTAACRLADLAVEAVRRHGLLSPDRIMFISFSNAACKHLAEKLPGFQVQCVTTRDPDLVHDDGVPGIDFSYSSYTSASHSNWVDRAHELGMTVGAWTVDATNAIDSMVACGVDAITSNYPDRVRDLLGSLELSLPRFAAGTSKFHATFIQSWKCRDWTAEEWRAEFLAAREAGFDALILQSCCDIVRGDPGAGAAQDPGNYPDVAAYCMYPSQIPELVGAFRSSQNGGDALALALDAAAETGMRLWIGTVNDDLWWKFGWGAPASDGAGGTYFQSWCASNAALCTAIVTEIRARYGATRGDRIAGWYYVNELWNFDAACAGTDGGLYARVLGANAAATIAAAGPGEPVLVCPFWNPDLSTPSQFGSFVSNFVAAAGFRPIDVYAPQDGGGAERAPAAIREWALAQKTALGGAMRFWIDLETFREADFSPKPIEDLRADWEAVKDLVSGAVVFAWHHYYEDTALAAPFSSFAREGARDRTSAPFPVPFAWLDDAFPRRAYAPAEFDALAESDPDGDGFATWAEYL